MVRNEIGRWSVSLAVMIIALILLSLNLSTPLQKYDEARRAVSALEMARGDAHPLVPTYAGQPDHWGTKPPLLIWCQAAAIKLVGAGPLAVRLPSVLATLVLCGFLLWWSHRELSSNSVGAVACLFVLTSADYLGNHGARTGDYDALLTLWLIAQVIFAYRFALGKPWALGLLGLTVVLAVWTKGIAGCLFLPGIAIWLLADGRGRRQLGRAHPYVIALLAVSLAFAYYPLRELLDPGYLQRVGQNELGGRYTTVNEGHAGPWYFYVRQLVLDEGNGWLVVLLSGLLLLVPVSFMLPKRGGPFGLLLTVLTSFLVVISLSATKLYWYKSPALPLLGLLLGLSLRGCALLLRQQLNRWKVGTQLLPFLLIVPLFMIPVIGAYQRQLELTPTKNFQPAAPPYTVAFTDTGFVRPFTLLVRGYQPQARFEALQQESVDLDYSYPPPGITVGDTFSTAVFSLQQRVTFCTTADWLFLSERYVTFDRHEAQACKQVYVHGLR